VPHPARGTAGRPRGVACPPRSADRNSPVTGLPSCEENRGLAEDLTLLAQLPDLTAQPPQLITLGDGEAIATATCVQLSLADPLTNRGLGQVQLPGDLTDLPVVRISSTTSALYSGGKHRRSRGIGLPSRGPGPHLGRPPDRVNSSSPADRLHLSHVQAKLGGQAGTTGPHSSGCGWSTMARCSRRPGPDDRWRSWVPGNFFVAFVPQGSVLRDVVLVDRRGQPICHQRLSKGSALGADSATTADSCL
jgi:hypothetical protein